MATGSETVGTIVDVVDRSRLARPHALAAEGVGGPLTYGELWERSGRVAANLVARGVKVEDRVGLWAAQSSELLVGILGIMRAGACYVPLEPTLPEARLGYLVRDAGVTTIVAPDEFTVAAASIVADVCGSTQPQAVEAALPDVTERHAAYVFYTSGSTGSPKGVVVEHRSVVLLLEWLAEESPLAEGGRILGSSSPAFDASVPLLLYPLLVGGTFVAIDADVARDARALSAELGRVRPAICVTAPTMLRMLMESGWQGDPALVVWTGGERTAADVIKYVAPRVDTLCNWYGPTETTVQVALGRLAADDAESPVRTTPRGTDLVLLDAQLQPVERGAAGEVVVVGEAVARGYLHDTALTADRFITLRTEDGERRAYRTGDLAIQHEDGSIVFLGRLDEQLNVRGYRIEPREVESSLLQHPSVHEAVVVASETDLDADRQLVAYVKAEHDVTGAQLRAFARQRLPSHMVPLIVLVDAYPLTTSGKVDRRRLAAAAAEASGPNDDDGELASATELERSVVRVFADVLGVGAGRVHLDDDFLDLGGTSLRSLRLFMQLEEELGVRLPLSTLTTASTPRTVAATVAAAQRVRTRAGRGEAPQHQWERSLGSIWTDVLGVEAVSRTDSFFDVGGAPADAQRMLDQLHALYGVRVSLREFEASPTIEDLATLVGRRTVRSVLVPLTTGGERAPLFLVAGAGGLAVVFLPLARMLGDDQPVFGLQTRGIEQRAVPDLTFRSTAARYVRTIREVQPHGPYLLGGHSLGGVHALNVAHRLRDEGEEVALLAIFDVHLTRRMVGRARLDRDDRHGGPSGSTTPRGLPRLRTVAHLPFIGVVPFRGTAQFEVFAALGELQAAACGRLRPYDGRTVVFLSDDEESVVIEARWGRLLGGEWRGVHVPGGHLAMLEQSNVGAAAQVLRGELDALAAPRAAVAEQASP